MKFFEFEEGKIYRGEVFEYRKYDNHIEFRSPFGQWCVSQLDPLELYKIDFTEVRSANEEAFVKLEKGVSILDEFGQEITVEANLSTYSRFCRGGGEDRDLFITISNTIGTSNITITFEDAEKIITYINELKALAERVRVQE